MKQQITKSSIINNIIEICKKKLISNLKTANSKINDLYNFQAAENGHEKYDVFRDEINSFLNEFTTKVTNISNSNNLKKFIEANLKFIKGLEVFLDEEIFEINNETGTLKFKDIDQDVYTSEVNKLYKQHVISILNEDELNYVVSKTNWNMVGISLSTALQFIGSFLNLEFKKFLNIFKSDINQVEKFFDKFVTNEELSEDELKLLVKKYYKDIKIYVKEFNNWEEEEHLILDEVYDEIKIISNEKNKIEDQKSASEILLNFFRMKVIKIILQSFNNTDTIEKEETQEDVIFSKLSAVEDLIAIGVAIDSKIEMIGYVKSDH